MFADFYQKYKSKNIKFNVFRFLSNVTFTNHKQQIYWGGFQIAVESPNVSFSLFDKDKNKSKACHHCLQSLASDPEVTFLQSLF